MKFLYCESHGKTFGTTTNHRNEDCMKIKIRICEKCNVMGSAAKMSESHWECGSRGERRYEDLTKADKVELVNKYQQHFSTLIKTHGE